MPPAGRSLREPAFIVSLVIAVVVALGFGVVVPVLPLFADSFGVGAFAVSMVIAAFAGVRLVSNIYSGSLADRIGTRRAVGYGALVVAVSSGLVATAQSYWWLLLFRGVGGFGSALFFTALLSLVVRTVGPDLRGRAVGSLQAAFLFGLTIGPTVGGLLAEPLGLRWPFTIYAIFCGAAGLVALRFLPGDAESHPEADDTVVSTDEELAPAASERPQGISATWRLTRTLSRDSAFLAALVMMASSRWAATGVRFSLIPIFGKDIGATPAVVGTALTLAALTHLALAWPAGKIADTFGRRGLSAPSYFLFAVIAFGLVFATTPAMFLVALALYGVGTGLTSVTPPAIVADVTPTEQTGLGIGVLNTVGDLGSVLGPLVSGLLAERLGYSWGFGASAALLAVGGVFALRMRETLPARAVGGLQAQREPEPSAP